MGSMNNIRYEHKMITNENRLMDVLSLIHHHKALFRKQYPNRIVNNIYFDTHGLKSYLDHVSGASHREKKRIRWYGTPRDVIDHPVLEQKVRMGLVGDKLTERLNPLPLDATGPWPIPGNAILHAKQFKDSLHWRLRSVHPVVAIRYYRHYFISADNQYRMTVDTNLEYFGISLTGKPQRVSQLPAPLIIELKYNKENANDAMNITNELPFRINRFSKYVFAIEGLRKNN